MKRDVIWTILDEEDPGRTYGVVVPPPPPRGSFWRSWGRRGTRSLGRLLRRLVPVFGPREVIWF
jgi:hypothetical protein